jgi:diacylglycerol kinase (ATP)
VRVSLVVNPQSRRGRQYGDVVREELRRLQISIVEDSFASDGIDAVVVAGGDGTIAGQIARAISLGVPLGIVPLGTFNDLARTLGVPSDIAGACGLVAQQRTRAIDVARVNGAYYATEASIGLSSRLARLQRPEEKQRFGFLAIVASIFQSARHARTFRAQVHHDGKVATLRAVQLTVANGPRFGGVISVEDAGIDDGWLDCYAVEIESAAQFFSVASAIIGGRRRSTRGLRTFRSATFEIATRRPHHCRRRTGGHDAGAL